MEASVYVEEFPPGLLLPTAHGCSPPAVESDACSSSSSGDGRTQRQRRTRQENGLRRPYRRRWRRRTTPSGGARAVDTRDQQIVVYPELYRHGGVPLVSDVRSWSCGLQPSESFCAYAAALSSLSLEKLVTCSSGDIVSMVWPQLCVDAKNLTHGPFSLLPEPPDILNVRFPDIDQVARFMRRTAIEIIKRHSFYTLVFFRSFVVRAAVNFRTKWVSKISSSVQVYAQNLFVSNWESESFCGNQNAIENMDDNCGPIIPYNDVNNIDYFDWVIALLSESLQQRIASSVLSSLHQVVDRCGLNCLNSTLSSWGVGRLTRTLLAQLDTAAKLKPEVNRECHDNWLVSVVSLLFKIALASKRIDTLLSLLRCFYRHPKLADELVLNDKIVPWITCIEACLCRRIRILFPVSWRKCYNVSLDRMQEFGISCANVVGMCATMRDFEPYVIILTRDGIYKIGLGLPHNLFAKNENVHMTDCCGVFIEGDRIAVQRKMGGFVTFYDIETLQLCGVLEECKSAAREKCLVYYGMGNFVIPHFYNSSSSPLYAKYDASVNIKGVVEPGFLFVPPGIRSLCIQFSLYIQPTKETTLLRLIHLTVSGKEWIVVRIEVNKINSYVSITFEHRGELVAEVFESMQEKWITWEATLASINGVARWEVRKDGVLLESKGNCGAMFAPSTSTKAIIRFLEGTFSGFIFGFRILYSFHSTTGVIPHGRESLLGISNDHLLCSFKMNEGAGCCFRGENDMHVWRGSAPSWCAPPNSTLLSHAVGCETSPYIPLGDYYLVTNEKEVAIVEKEFCTWIDVNGRIIEQQFLKVNPRELPFFCISTGRMCCVCFEKDGLLGLRWTQTCTTPAKQIQTFASVKSGGGIRTKVLDCVQGGNQLTPLLFLHYLLHCLNSELLKKPINAIGRNCDQQLFLCDQLSPRIVSRLFDISEELIQGVISFKEQNNFLFTVLSVCGRLLLLQLEFLKQGCPHQFVSRIVNIYERLREQSCEPESFLAESQQVFSQVHSLFFVKCASTEHKLRRIIEANSLEDVKDLFLPKHLHSLVNSAIENNLNELFMVVLDRLKKDCLVESEYVLCNNTKNKNNTKRKNGEHSFKPSCAVLEILLLIFSQKIYPHWHLVAVSLVSFLCKEVLRMYDSFFSSEIFGEKEVSILKETSIGIVVFPITHFLADSDIDSSILVDILNLLNDMRLRLAPYIPALPPDLTTSCFTETHRVFAPDSEQLSFFFDLRYAQSIEVSYEQMETNVLPAVHVSLLTNNYRRLVKKLICQQLIFHNGGKLEITFTPGEESKGVVIIVKAFVKVQVQAFHWIKDMSVALAHAILYITRRLLLTDFHDTHLLPRDSIFRGGLSPDVLAQHNLCFTLNTVEEEKNLLYSSDHVELLRLCEGTGSLFSKWQSMCAEKQLPCQERLEPILRLFCAAHAWHLNRPKNISLEKSFERSFDFMRKKSFLILESLQQENKDVMLERAIFLLKKVNPRAKFEQREAEGLNTSGTQPLNTLTLPTIHSIKSMSSFSCDCSISQGPKFLKRSATVEESLSTFQCNALGGINRPRNSLLLLGALKENVKSSYESLSMQIFNFLLTGYNGISTEQLESALVKKTQQATVHAAAYKLQEELCAFYQYDEYMALSILCSSLYFRELAHLQCGSVAERADNGKKVELSSFTESLSREFMENHYIEHMIGCGFHKEFDLQKASCGFLNSIIQQSFFGSCIDTTHSEQQQNVRAISLCAILCHPWDSVDISLIRPAKFFCVLKKYLFLATSKAENFLFNTADTTTSSSSFYTTSSEKGDDAWLYFVNECGLFSLTRRGVIISNTMHTSSEKVSIVQGETVGIHIEDAEACCLACNRWNALRSNNLTGYFQSESDCLVGLLNDSVVTDMPDALYFEVTLEVVFCEGVLISVGVANSYFNTALPPEQKNLFLFSSDGVVTHGDMSFEFSSKWSIGDVIGCGIMAPFSEVFFTRNGEFLGIATDCSFASFIPFISVSATSTLVKLIVNFGENCPFRFDIASLHRTCRTRLTSPAMLSDSAFITAHYLVTLCYKHLLRKEKNEELIASEEDSVPALLEEAAVFFREVVLTVVRQLKHMKSEPAFALVQENKIFTKVTILLARLFHTVGLIVDCFRFSAVTSTTHFEILRLCSATIIDADDKWAKVRAARCMRKTARLLPRESFGNAVMTLRRFVAPDVIVNSLVRLTHTSVFCAALPPAFVPLWCNGTTTVVGMGAFYGASPLPSRGTHTIGFRIRRQQQEGQSVGSPLGGYYYVGLSHGHPQITSPSSLISRSDIYVLQDMDDQEQVRHLISGRQRLLCNGQGQSYGNGEIVWLEFNADLGEITYYRNKMIPTGFSFANISPVDDLYPFVFLFNDDASCELIQDLTRTEDVSKLLLNGLQRSVAIHTLQQLHAVPEFGVAVSNWVHCSLIQLDKEVDRSFLALAILGGEKSYEYCIHDTRGTVILEAVSSVASKAVVYLESDEDMRLFSTDICALTPSFVKPPIFFFSEEECIKCSRLLLSELCRSLYEASFFAPLIRLEEEKRNEIEKFFFEVSYNVINFDFVRVFNLIHNKTDDESRVCMPRKTSIMPLIQSTCNSFMMHNGTQPASKTPVTIDKHYSTSSLYSSNPSIGVTFGRGYSVVRGSVLSEDVFSFVVAITGTGSNESLLYVGVSADTKLITMPQQVTQCRETWALCNQDKPETNSVNCSVEPGMIFNADTILFGLGDLVIIQVNRQDGTVSFSRVRNGTRADFGILFEKICPEKRLRPFVFAGPNTVVVFSFLDCQTFPARNIFPFSTSGVLKGSSPPVRCSYCEVEMSELWYESENTVYLCQDCFNTWRFPKHLFSLVNLKAPLPNYIVLRNSPKELVVGGIVEFVENPVVAWSNEKSVNTNIDANICIAEKDSAFAVLEPINTFAHQRVDISLGHVAGVDGSPYGCIRPFSLLWRNNSNFGVDNHIVDSGLFLASLTTFPHGSKVVIELKFADRDKSTVLKSNGLFIGVTKLPCGCEAMSEFEFKQGILDHQIWGTWCDFVETFSFLYTLYFLVDTSRSSILASSSLLGLIASPVVVSCNGLAENETNLRLCIYSHVSCEVFFVSGFLSSSDIFLEKSFSFIGIGVFPENVINPQCDILSLPNFLFDTAADTVAVSGESIWKFSSLIAEENLKTVFFVGDTLTITQENNMLAVYRNGLLIATCEHMDDNIGKEISKRLIIYFSVRGMFAKIVPPLYGKSHIGKVMKTFGKEVGIVECMCPCLGRKQYAVRRNDVKFCALSADFSSIKLGAHVAFKSDCNNAAIKRGVVISFEKNIANIRSEEDESNWLSIQLESLYLIDNEGSSEVAHGFYSIPTLHTSKVTHVFDIGKSKYGVGYNGFSNGIMFDIYTHRKVVLTGLSVASNATGRHRVDVFFKTGTHNEHEEESALWTRVFSGFVDMHFKQQFSISFSEIHLEAKKLVALYINATHNSAVGYYSEEDGCSGNISSIMDTDGVFSVYFGRTSESSTPFLKTGPVPRGFCGSITYTQNRDVWPLLVKAAKPLSVELFLRKKTKQFNNNYFGNIDTSSANTINNGSSDFNALVLRSYPFSTCIDTKAEFVIEVFDRAITIQKLFLPIMIARSGVKKSFGQVRLCISLFYAIVNEYCGEKKKKDYEWTCVNRVFVPFQENIFFFITDNLNLSLGRGTYIFNAVCWVNHRRCGELLRCFLNVKDENCLIKNDFYSVCGLSGSICAAVTENTMLSGSISTIYSCQHFNQNNSASYNGIMFDICSKEDILLEEIFCVAQTTANNVHVKVFWKEGSMEGAEKIPSQWHEIISTEHNIVDKQFFSPGQLNLLLNANKMYALYVNTASSCGIRFYNNSDGNLGDVCEEFENDGVLTIFIGKKSQSSLPFTDIPDEPRAFRGHITYRVFLQQSFVNHNQAFFSSMQALIITRIFAVLISFVGSACFSSAELFEESAVIEALEKLSSLRVNTSCQTDTAGDLLNSAVTSVSFEEIRDGIVTLPFSDNNALHFSSFAKGDLAVATKAVGSDIAGRLVSLATDPDKNWCVLLEEYDNKGNNCLSISLDCLLPIIICSECYSPFATTKVCKKTGRVHLPFENEKDELLSILKRYISQWNHLDLNLHNKAVPWSVLANTLLCNNFFGIQKNVNLQASAGCVAILKDDVTLEYIVSPNLLWGRENLAGAPGFIFPFLYHGVMKAYVSISFTLVAETWKVMFFSDLPFRLGSNSSLKVFSLLLEVIISDGTRKNLLLSPMTYYAASGTSIYMCLPISASFLHFSCMPDDGNIHFFLSILEKKMPCVTPALIPATTNVSGSSTELRPWLWSNMSEFAELQPGTMCALQGPFDLLRWSCDEYRSCNFTVTSTFNTELFFFELYIFFSSSANVSSVDKDKDESYFIHHSFKIFRNGVFGLAFTAEGNFILYDGDDNILYSVASSVVAQHFSSVLLSDSSPTIAIKNVGTHPVTVRLKESIKARKPQFSRFVFGSLQESNFYFPMWVLYNSEKVVISGNGLTASCKNECGQAVIGLSLPMTKISAFTVQINRFDRLPGDSLGSGHFAGIVASTFKQLVPHFEVLGKHVDSVWLVQDVYDSDSLPTQERIPFMRGSFNEVFLCGTQLHFIFNRENGTLSLARDNELPRIVFRNIPSNLQVSPFVRLDHINSSATLAPFGCDAWDRGDICLKPPCATLDLQPSTPGFLFRLPFDVVCGAFGVFSHVVSLLPSRLVSAIANAWCGACFVRTRFAYRLSEAVTFLVEVGAFSKQLFCSLDDNDGGTKEKILNFCSTDEMQNIIRNFLELEKEAVVVIYKGNKDVDNVVFCLSDDYEIVGRIRGSSGDMVRLLHFNNYDAPNERTLHVVSTNDSCVVLSPCNVVTRNSCVMYQEEIIRAYGNTSMCGVITHGWYDCTLASMKENALDLCQQSSVSMSIINALEHWHLHGFSHGHIKPDNVYIRIDQSGIVKCALWNISFLQREEPCASPGLRLYGRRDKEGDKWSCAHILNTFSALLQTNYEFESAVQKIKMTKLSISDIITETGLFCRELRKNFSEQTLCIPTRVSTNMETGSCNGIMFDIFAKLVELKVTKISFVSNVTVLAQVTLFVYSGSYSGVETDENKWRLLLREEKELVKNVEVVLEDFDPIIIPATGERAALFIHTSSRNGVLFCFEREDVKKDMISFTGEEDVYIGITPGKTFESTTPFTGIQNNGCFFKGCITYVLPFQHSVLPIEQGVMTAFNDIRAEFQGKAFCPVVVCNSRFGILLTELKDEECLVFMGNGCEWVSRDSIRLSKFNESSDFAELDALLHKKLLERRKPPWEMDDQQFCCRQIMFFMKLLSIDVPDTQAGQRTTPPMWWWVSDPITSAGIVSVWQVIAMADASLFLTTLLDDVFSIDSLDASNLLRNGQAFLCIDDWSRSVIAFENNNKRIIRKLRYGILNEDMRLVFGPVKAEVKSAPVVAFLNTSTEDIKLIQRADGTSLILLSSETCVQENIFLNGVMLSCSAEPGTNATITPAVSFGQIGNNVCITPLNIGNNQGGNNEIEQEYKNFSCFFLEIQPGRNWRSLDVVLQTDSKSLDVLGSSVRQIRHGSCFTCTVNRPIFAGLNAHKVELFILTPRCYSVRLSLQHLPTSWSVDIPIPWFMCHGDSYILPSGDVQSVHLFLYVFPHLKRVLASVNGGALYNVLSGLNCPSVFQLVICLSWPASFVQIKRWEVLDGSETATVKDILDTAILSQLWWTGCISPNVSHSLGLQTRYSRDVTGPFHLKNKTDSDLVSQLRAAMVAYARQLLGTVILTYRPQSWHKKLLKYISLTHLRGDLIALENLVSSDIRNSCFSLVSAASSYLSIPKIAQSVDTVEVSVNIVYISLNHNKILPFLSTEFGSALLLLLLRTATGYTRSIRQMSLSGVLILLKVSTLTLPPHETLSACFAPILGMINRLCKKGKISSSLVQLGVLIICELIRRYSTERPTLTAPGKNSVIPYAIVTCTMAVINAMTSNPPLPLHKAFVEELDEPVHCIKYEVISKNLIQNTFKSSYGVFLENFCCTFGVKSFKVVLSTARKGSVIVGWDLEKTEKSSAVICTEEQKTKDKTQEMMNLLPSCGYFIDYSGKIFVCLGRKKELQPLRCRAKGGDTIIVKCFYHEQVVVIGIFRGSRSEIDTRFENFPNEKLTVPFFFVERSEDAVFNGEQLDNGLEDTNFNKLFDKIQQNPTNFDTAVAPQSYEFYAELALFFQTVVSQEIFIYSMESKEDFIVYSHDLASFPLISQYLSVDVFGGNKVLLNSLFQYITRLRILDVLTIAFFKVVDFRQKSELFQLWTKLKLLCSSKTSEKIQTETLKPFQNRTGQKARVVIHTMRAHSSVRYGPYSTLMRSVFGQLFEQLHKSSILTFYASPMFSVKLAGFGSTDAGGPYRDILSQLASEIMTTHPNDTFQLNPLFAPCGRGGQSAIMPNMKMMLNSQSSLMFEFFGKILAACFMTQDLLTVEFPPLFWKLLLSEDVAIRDLLSIDSDIISQTTVEKLMDRTSDELEERFPGILEIWANFCAENLLDTNTAAELPPSNVPHAQLLAEKIVKLELHKYDTAMSYIKRGFDEVIPLYTLNAFRWQQVELRICGAAGLSYDALRNACEIKLSTNNALMFLDVISSITDEDRMLLLRFTTGQTRLQLKEPIKVYQSESRDSLPTSSTCFFTLRLPFYSSLEIMREKILYAIRQCKAIDTDGQAREHIILDS